MRLKISEIVEAVGGRLLCGDPETAVTAFSTDSRTVKPGVMFVPIRGEKTDAHQYIDAVFAAGGTASFTDHPIPQRDQPLVLVEDCRLALQKAAACYRSQFSLPIVGVTGSVGKTTSKEMIAQALSSRFRVMKTAGNQNSQVGVPITVCGLRKEHTAAVVEMGVSMAGEMARIAAVVRPTCAVMTNIGVSHLEYLKTRENIMAEKLHIADYLGEEGVLFVNGDDDLLPDLKETCGHKVITFGLGPLCDWQATGLNQMEKGTFFTLLSKLGEKAEVFVPAPGLHNVRNALAAVAVARYLGESLEGAVRAIGAYKPPAMRQEISQAGGLTIIDDSYNASPDSMKGALDILAGLKLPGKRAAALADMLELGSQAQAAHLEVGRYAREKGIDLLAAIGPLSKDIAAGFGEGARWFPSRAEAAAYLKEVLGPGDGVLVKGSRSMRTDEIVAVLKESVENKK